jgi:hypothetical protein
MDYIERIKAAGFGENPLYQRDDIGVSRLFYDLHSDVIRYVIESKTWYAYDGRRWVKSSGIFRASELCKDFAKAVCEYAETCHADDDGFVKYARKLASRRPFHRAHQPDGVRPRQAPAQLPKRDAEPPQFRLAVAQRRRPDYENGGGQVRPPRQVQKVGAVH